MLDSRIEGPVRISTPPGIAESFIGPLFNELAQRHPALRFEIDASTRQGLRKVPRVAAVWDFLVNAFTRA